MNEVPMHVDKREALQHMNAALMRLDLFSKAPGMDMEGKLALKIASDAVEMARAIVQQLELAEGQ